MISKPYAWLLTGSKHYKDSVVLTKESAERRLAERGRDSATIEPLYRDPSKTIAAQQIVLDQIAAALGVETGDVEGIGREIERLKKAVAKYAGLHIDDLHEALAGGEAV